MTLKKTLSILLAMLLCVFLAACSAQPNVPTTESTDSSSEGPTFVVPTDPATESVNPSVADNVTPPDEMPEKPEADFSLPPGEQPGERGEVIDK